MTHGKKWLTGAFGRQLLGNDLMFCLITRLASAKKYTASIRNNDYEIDSLNWDSDIKFYCIFTVNEPIVGCRADPLKYQKLTKIFDQPIKLKKNQFLLNSALSLLSYKLIPENLITDLTIF